MRSRLVSPQFEEEEARRRRIPSTTATMFGNGVWLACGMAPSGSRLTLVCAEGLWLSRPFPKMRALLVLSVSVAVPRRTAGALRRFTARYLLLP